MSERPTTLRLVPAILAALLLRRSGALPGRRDSAGAGAAETGYEHGDVAAGKVALVMGLLAGTAIAAVAVVFGLSVMFQDATRRTLPPLTPQQTARLDPPPPNLQADPYADIDRQRAAERARLEGYGYLGADRTRARIPIDRARALTVGRSLDP